MESDRRDDAGDALRRDHRPSCAGENHMNTINWKEVLIAVPLLAILVYVVLIGVFL
jgi:hypothetical protein